MKIRLVAALAIALSITGCGKFDSVVMMNADTVIKKSLKAPSSYKVINQKVLWEGKNREGYDAYIVKTEYDAQNGFGATIRGCRYNSIIFLENKKMTWSNTFGDLDCEGNVGSAGSYDGTVSEETFIKTLIKGNDFVDKNSNPKVEDSP